MSAADEESPPPPPLAALFLIKFDLKVGYTISWKQSLPAVPLDGIVEYKSLPSGLHKVKEDLVYFVHEQWAGVSAFRNADASASERGARFLAVGALVRRGDGRLGRAWEHAGALVGLAAKLALEDGDVDALEGYWEKWRGSESEEEDEQQPDSPYTLAKRRNRALSSLTTAAGVSPAASGPRQRLPEYHPAYSMLAYLDTFGPLVFPLHRMALLRKRILVITPPPVRAPCDYVYDLSILSSLPHSLSFTPPSLSLTRLRPLFNLGIHDIPYLTELSKTPSDSQQPNGASPAPEDSQYPESSGWIACTTDEILAMKTDLYDVLVELPHPDRIVRPTSSGKGRRPKNKGVGGNRYPVLRLSNGGPEVKATQRDLRRYRSLRRALAPLTNLGPAPPPLEDDVDDDDDENSGENTHLLYNSVHGTPKDAVDEGEQELHHRAEEEHVTERPTWSALAYSSFMWWAAAGERDEALRSEDDVDAGLLANLPDVVEREVGRRGYRDRDDDDDDDEGRSAEVEMAIIGYFHRVSKALFERVEVLLEEPPDGAARPVDCDAVRDDEDEESEGGVVRLESDDLRGCGLDVWSARDRQFLAAFVDLWFARDVEVRGAGVECCGMRIC